MVVSLLHALTDLLWPPRCAACGARMGPATDGATLSFCDLCTSSLMPSVSPRCPRCALPFESAGPDHLCLECLKRPPAFASLTAVYQYGAAAADAVLRLKYGRETHLGPLMGRRVSREMAGAEPFDIVMPIPLHPAKLRERGFNQSALIARPVARRLGVPMDTSAMVRVQDTAPQAGLTREERLENVRGAFVVPKAGRVSGRRVLLVDDVVTTATTVREAAKVLRRSGARGVDVAAFARAGR